MNLCTPLCYCTVCRLFPEISLQVHFQCILICTQNKFMQVEMLMKKEPICSSIKMNLTVSWMFCCFIGVTVSQQTIFQHSVSVYFFSTVLYFFCVLAKPLQLLPLLPFTPQLIWNMSHVLNMLKPVSTAQCRCKSLTQ